MTDGMGRTIDYIRISVTDRCNLRCRYCMPEEGVERIPHERILRFGEIRRIVAVLAGMGLKKVKITGGEPLVRRGVTDLIAGIRGIPGIENITLTTNGVLLEEMYDGLAGAGLDAVTVSLDTLDPARFREITRRDEAERVIRGIRQAVLKNRIPLKINCVPMGDPEEQGILELVELARSQPIHVRFIEMMPIGPGTGFPFVSEEAVKGFLEARVGTLTPCSDVRGNGPCQYYAAEGFCGRIGFISAVSHKFCSECNRVRLTAEGFLKTCLQYDTGVELKPLLASGCSDEEVAAAIEKALRSKPSGHDFGGCGQTAGAERRGMSQIGG
jgi:cyclic pyranopterin phosphate synthase